MEGGTAHAGGWYSTCWRVATHSLEGAANLTFGMKKMTCGVTCNVEPLRPQYHTLWSYYTN